MGLLFITEQLPIKYILPHLDRQDERGGCILHLCTCVLSVVTKSIFTMILQPALLLVDQISCLFSIELDLYLSIPRLAISSRCVHIADYNGQGPRAGQLSWLNIAPCVRTYKHHNFASFLSCVTWHWGCRPPATFQHGACKTEEFSAWRSGLPFHK